MAETSTPSIRVVLDHPRTPPRSRQGLQFEISDAMKKSKATKLLTSYHDPRQPGSLGDVTRFARAQKLPVREVRETLERDLGYTLHKPRRFKIQDSRRRHFPTLPVMVFGIDEQWVADLMEVINISKSNRGYRYLLTVVTVFSKYAWVEPAKTKTGHDMTIAFDKTLKRSQGRQPQNLQKSIHHFSTSGDTKARIAERFNRTLKERLYRYFTIKNTLTFLPVLQDLVLGYNLSYHRSIKMAPGKVTASNQEEVWNNLYAKRLNAKRLNPKFKVNDRVRLNKKFRTFKKGYLPG